MLNRTGIRNVNRGIPKTIKLKENKMTKTTLIVMTTAAICMTLSTAQAVPVAPVPEPSTVISGALLLLPLSVGAARAIFKNRGKK